MSFNNNQNRPKSPILTINNNNTNSNRRQNTNNNNNMNNKKSSPFSTSNNTTSSFMGNSSFSSLVTKLPNPPSYLHRGQLQFIIMDAPTDDNLFLYIDELRPKSVSIIVRTCEPTYNSEGLLKENSMSVIDIAFPDGHPPCTDIVDEWLQIVAEENIKYGRPIAVHCVAGLGRAPVLVAIALIEIGDMLASDAVELIRHCRRGAINQKQYEYLKTYQKRHKHECFCTIL